MLKNLRSRLVRIHLTFIGSAAFYHDWWRNEWPDHNPAVLLAHSMDTLKEISGFAWQMHDQEEPDLSFVFPEMRCLALESASLPLAAVLMHAYPNLTHLSYVSGMGDHYSVGQSEVIRARHHLNVREQSSAIRTWNRLETFQGSLMDFYALGLTCLVDDVSLDGTKIVIPEMLKTMLDYTRPRSLQFDGYPDRADVSAANLCDAVRGEGGSRLESLIYEIMPGSDENDVDVAGILEGLLLSLRHSPLQTMKVEISTRVSFRPVPPEDGEVVAPTRRPADELDVED
ncbi:hypothetical protein BV20DRAFT_861710 [Pilatotrama ljubarskyi]|nr:hypothetical protein BV20DRAFT_861710 [Pilatotrama ljubarskyi]